MKTLVKNIAFTLVFITTISFTVNATGKGKGKNKKKAEATNMIYKAAINEHNGNMIAVQFMKPSNQKVSITVRDQTGKIIKHEVIKKHNLVVKKYVLDQFPAGTYQIEVQNGDQILKKKIYIAKTSTN